MAPPTTNGNGSSRRNGEPYRGPPRTMDTRRQNMPIVESALNMHLNGGGSVLEMQEMPRTVAGSAPNLRTAPNAALIRAAAKAAVLDPCMAPSPFRGNPRYGTYERAVRPSDLPVGPEELEKIIRTKSKKHQEKARAMMADYDAFVSCNEAILHSADENAMYASETGLGGDVVPADPRQTLLDHRNRTGGSSSNIEMEDASLEDLPHPRERRGSIVSVVGRYVPWFGFKHFKDTGGFFRMNGMSTIVTALFVIGETAGGGLVALPKAIVQMGIPLGLALMIMIYIITMDTARMIGQAWSLIVLRDSRFRHHCGSPYATMAGIAFGKWVEKLVNAMLNFTQYATAAVFLVLGSRIFNNIGVALAGQDIPLCNIIIVISTCIFPLLLLRSPNDMKGAILLAMALTVGAVFALTFAISMDMGTCANQAPFPEPTILSVFQGMGTIFFAYGGHAAFPTIIGDMERGDSWTTSSRMAFSGINVLYFPIGFLGAYTYGATIQDTILASIQNKPIAIGANLAIAFHLIFALTIIFAPLMLWAESVFKVPKDFGWKRVVLRGAILMLTAFTSLTVPNFGPLLDMIGGSLITIMATVLPCAIALVIKTKADKFTTKLKPHDELEQEKISFRDVLHHRSVIELLWSAFIIIAGLVICVGCTAAASKKLTGDLLTTPCYIEWYGKYVSGSIPIPESQPFEPKYFCCGIFKNISHWGTEMCMPPDAVFKGASH